MQPAGRKCLHLYCYFLDRQLGLIHVKLQTWFPFPIQVSVNGHEWVARRLARHGLRYQKRHDVFLHVSGAALGRTAAAEPPGVRASGATARIASRRRSRRTRGPKASARR